MEIYCFAVVVLATLCIGLGLHKLQQIDVVQLSDVYLENGH